jgi:hypothetical protein
VTSAPAPSRAAESSSHVTTSLVPGRVRFRPERALIPIARPQRQGRKLTVARRERYSPPLATLVSLGWCLSALGLTAGQEPAGSGFASIASCTPIDFETVPGSTPTEGLLIADQFKSSQGVEFRLETGGSPRLAAVGRPATAFVGPPSQKGPRYAG